MSTKPRYRVTKLAKGWYVTDTKTNLTVCGPVQRIVAECAAEIRNRHEGGKR
jgi:hypothetical protein